MNHRIKLDSDFLFLQKLGELLDELEKEKIDILPQVTVSLGTSPPDQNGTPRNSGYFQFPRTSLSENTYSKKNALISRVTVPIKGIIAGEPNRAANLHFETQSSYRQLTLDFEGRQGVEDKVLSLVNLIERFFPPLKISAAVDKNIESLLSDLHAVRDSISSESEQALSRLADTIATVHADSLKRIDEHIVNRDEHFTELEEKNRTKFEAESDRIKALEKSLIEKEAALNLKEPIGERRRIHSELRQRLLEQVQNFRPSQSVNRSRYFVRFANLLLIVSSIGAFSFFALKFTGEESRNGPGLSEISAAGVKVEASEANNLATPFYVLAYIKLTLSALAVFGFSAAYIRWEGRVADRLSETEFKIRDKAVDIERSAWIVETVEALTTGDKKLPEGLLQLLGNNLFDNREHSESEAENLSNFLQHLVGKKGSFETHLPGGGSVTMKANGSRPKSD